MPLPVLLVTGLESDVLLAEGLLLLSVHFALCIPSEVPPSVGHAAECAAAGAFETNMLLLAVFCADAVDVFRKMFVVGKPLYVGDVIGKFLKRPHGPGNAQSVTFLLRLVTNGI